MSESKDFVREIIDQDLEDGRHDNVVTRWPPEPNGYPHIGHAKAIVINFELAREYGGRCHLRFDDTNPETESTEYVESLKEAVRWLGYDWGEHLYFASDYFDQMYEYALKLIRQGDAYVDSLSVEEMREYRGTATEPGKPSPYRDRSVEENLELFKAMRSGEFDEGEHVLRAKIDMTHDHLLMRDPLLFRIRHKEHYRQGNEWPIYPMYDYAHPLEDAIEGITHSLCTLEFDTHREVYDWVLEHCLDEDEQYSRPRQYEFSRLNLGYTVMSKTKIRNLIEDDYVENWDDPRLPSIAGLRRRGVSPEAIRSFVQGIGITRTQSRIQMSRLENEIRTDLETSAPRVMGVVDPLEVEITNFPENETEWIEASHWPENVDKESTREIPLTRTLYIDRDDFREDPPEDFIRLAPEREVRLLHGYFLTCEEVVKNDDGEVVKLCCTYDPETDGGTAPDGRSPAGTIHWVSTEHGIPVKFRLYDRLFTVSDPDERDEPYYSFYNEDSLNVTEGYLEPSVRDDSLDRRYQLERVGYFRRDKEDGDYRERVWNRIVSLYDSRSDEDGEDMEEKRRQKQKEKERHRRRSMEQQGDRMEQLAEDQKQYATRLMEQYDVDRDVALIVAGTREVMKFTRKAIERDESLAEAIAKRAGNELLRAYKEQSIEELPFGREEFVEYVRLIEEGTVSTGAAEDLFEALVETGDDPETIVEEQGLKKVGAREELEPVVREVVEEYPDQVQQYRSGSEEVINFFIGQVMGKTGGNADPALTKELLEDQLTRED